MIYTKPENRAESLGRYIAQTGCTVRQAAKAFDISKSTVHTDVAHRLRQIDFDLWENVQVILQKNKQTRHIRGGMATKEKYEKMKE